MSDDAKIITIRDELERRVVSLENRLEEVDRAHLFTWGNIIKTAWPFVLAFIAATAFVLANIYNKAPAENVNKLSETVNEHSIKIKRDEKLDEWVVNTIYTMAKSMGIDPGPPPLH